MFDIGARIKHRRQQLGFSAEKVAELVGVSPATMYRYEKNEIASMGTDKLLPIANALGVSPAYLMGWEDVPNSSPLPTNLIPASALTRKSIPLIGNVAAGEPIFAEESYDTYLDIDSDCRVDYALRVKGDSMYPTYQDGDVIYIRQQPDVSPGQVAVVLVDDSATLKHVYHDRRTGEVSLVSDNPDYPPMHYYPDDGLPIRILGVPVGFTRMYTAARNQRTLTARELESRVIRRRKSAEE